MIFKLNGDTFAFEKLLKRQTLNSSKQTLSSTASFKNVLTIFKCDFETERGLQSRVRQ